MANYIDYGGATVPALQTGHPNSSILRVREPSGGGTPPLSANPVPVAANLKGGATGVAYSETISVQGGTAPYTFAVTAGALPTGTSLNASTGVISGTPSAAASYSFTITVTDVNSNAGSQNFVIVISATSGGSGGEHSHMFVS